MCLQWCHVTHQLIDNDISCEHCHPSTRFAFDGCRCPGCRHAILRPNGMMCRLTHTPIPRYACCHYDCSPDDPADGLLKISINNIAPGLLAYYGVDTVAGLFDRSETAPDYQYQRQHVLVFLADLAVPEVYGLPAGEWEWAF